MTGEPTAQRIRDVRFTSLTFRRGYDMDQVDDLLDALEAAAREGRSLAAIVAGAQLRLTRLRPGYAIDEVDAFLADIVRPADEH